MFRHQANTNFSQIRFERWMIRTVVSDQIGRLAPDITSIYAWVALVMAQASSNAIKGA